MLGVMKRGRRILENWVVTDDEWDVFGEFIPPNAPPSPEGGRPMILERVVFQAMIRWLADGLAKRRVYEYTGVSYDTLTRRFDEWIKAGVFVNLHKAALENHDELCGLKKMLIFVDGAINVARNGGTATGKNPTDRSRSGSKRSPVSDALGTPLGLIITGANRHDSILLDPTLESSLVELEVGAEIDLDRAYRGKPCEDVAAKHGLKIHVTPPKAQGRVTRAARCRRSPIERLHQKFNLWRGVKVRVIRADWRWLALLQLDAAMITFRATSFRIANST
jgi:transposase